MHRLRDRGDGVTLWAARADPLDSRAPHGLLGQAVRRTIGIADDDALGLRQQRLRDHLAQRLPSPSALSRVLPFAAEIVGCPFGDDDFPVLEAARADRALMAEHIRRAFEEWIISECTARPLLVVLDDAHWSDAATLRLLDAALKAAADHPLLVAVFARPALRGSHPSLFTDRRLQELRLEELPKRSAERLARAILGPSVPVSVIERVVAVSNGNAFFLEELARAVAEGANAALPDSVLSVVEARLGALEPDARRVLRAASVFGQFFWPGGVAAVLGDTDEEAARAWIGTLARREIVTLRSQSRYGDEPELTFRHVLVRDTAYSMLTVEDRAIAHRAAATWLEAHGEREAAVLAAHLEAGRDLGRAAKQYLRAATQMLESGALGSVRDLTARALACGPDETTRAEILMIDVDACRWLGDLDRASQCAEEVMSLVPFGSDSYMKALATAALAHLKLGRVERHRELVATAIRCIESSTPSKAVCRLAASTGVAVLFGGALPTALSIDAMLERLIDTGVDATDVPMVHIFRAFLSDATGNLEGQVLHFEAAAASFERIHDERNMLVHRANAAFARSLVGDYDEAARRLFDVVSAAERGGLKFVLDTAHGDLGGTLERMGRFDEARVYAERLRAFGPRVTSGWSARAVFTSRVPFVVSARWHTRSRKFTQRSRSPIPHDSSCRSRLPRSPRWRSRRVDQPTP
jgi:tetratricopeptide (TPR) repeat protein